MEEYLTTEELSKYIKMSPGTIRNHVWKKVFEENVHYLKPNSGKLLFISSAIDAWLRGCYPTACNGCQKEAHQQDKCLISI